MSKCIWTEQYQGEYWETACGQAFFFDTGEVKENGFIFCPYCGQEIEPVYQKEAEDG